MDDFTALIELFKPMFQTMLLIWKHSGYYDTSAKMVTLIREMCNDLIMQACKFVPGVLQFALTSFCCTCMYRHLLLLILLLLRLCRRIVAVSS